MKKLDIAEFESVLETRKRQNDMIDRLEHSDLDPGRYAGLKDCRWKHLGQVRCAEACFFGTLRRSRKQMSAVRRLMQNGPAPVHELRIIRARWARPFRSLRDVSIAAAKQLTRRALDKLDNPNLVAIGTFKVSPAPEHENERWMCEVHMIVAGATKDELEKAYSPGRIVGLADIVWVKEAENLDQTISNVLGLDLQVWRHPAWPEQPASSPTRARRGEYYGWLLGLRRGERMIRYGCDRYFNKLIKQPRTIRPKIPKKRPYPMWLRYHMFGHGRWKDVDPQSVEYQTKIDQDVDRKYRQRRAAVDDPGPGYYDDIDDEPKRRKKQSGRK